VDVFRGAHFNDAPMFEGAGKSRHGLDVGFGEQIVETRVEQICIQFESLGVARDEVRLGFDNAGELNAGDIVNPGNEASCVVMGQADDGEADGWSILSGGWIGGCGKGQEGEEKPFHGEQIVRLATEAKTKSA